MAEAGIGSDGTVVVREGPVEIAFAEICPAAIAEGFREILAGKASRFDGVAASGDLLVVGDIGLAGATAVLQGLRLNR